MTSGRFARGIAALVVAVVAAACGEDVDFGGPPPGDASTKETSLESSVVDSSTTDADSSAVDSAPCATGEGGAPACRAVGAP